MPGLGQRSVRLQLAILVLVAALPLFLVSIWHLLQGRDHDRTLAREQLQVLVDGTANRLQASLRDYAGTLSLIASQPLVKAMDVGRCDPLIDGFVRLHPEFVTIGTRDLQGQSTTHDALVRAWQVKAAPTVLFLGPGGREVADRLVGGSPDFYSAYLDGRLERARQAVRKS